MRQKANDAQLAQDEIASLYNRIAPVYDIWSALTESRARARAVALAEVADGETVLEVAVGTGAAFVELVKANPNGVNLGIDLSPGMLSQARQRLASSGLTNYQLQQGSAFNLDVEAGMVDKLFNNYMFDLIAFEDMTRVLDEFYRVLKTGGKLILVNMTEAERPGSGIYARLSSLFPRAMGGCRGVSLTEPLEQKGFEVELREYHQQMLFPSEVILASKR